MRNTYTINLNFATQLQAAPLTKENTAMGYVNWGKDNLYPQHLLDLILTSPTHSACLQFEDTALFGGGIDLEAMQILDTDLPNPNYYTDWNQFIQGIITDYNIFGSFAFQIIRNRDRKTFSFFNVPFASVRSGLLDNDGVVNDYYISSDWSKHGVFKPIRIKAFGFQPDAVIRDNDPYLYVYKPYSPFNDYYPTPKYTSGIKAIQTEGKLQNFDLKKVSNCFIPSGSISLPKPETEEEKQAIIENIQRMFVGDENANSLMINFRENDEDNAVQFTSFQAHSENVNLFNDTDSRVVDKIITSHRINNKGLIGLPMDNTGFSDSGKLLETALSIYMKLVGDQDRKKILSAINNALKLNGVETTIVMKPLSLSSETVEPTAKTEEPSSEVNSQAEGVSENNATEKVTSNAD